MPDTKPKAPIMRMLPEGRRSHFAPAVSATTDSADIRAGAENAASWRRTQHPALALWVFRAGVAARGLVRDPNHGVEGGAVVVGRVQASDAGGL